MADVDIHGCRLSPLVKQIRVKLIQGLLAYHMERLVA